VYSCDDYVAIYDLFNRTDKDGQPAVVAELQGVLRPKCGV
jgi:hypothetical protein